MDAFRITKYIDSLNDYLFLFCYNIVGDCNMNKLVKNKTIYLVSLELKNELLRYITNNKLLLDIHFFSFNEFIKRAYFDYDYNAIYYLMNTYNYKYDVAKLYLDNLI